MDSLPAASRPGEATEAAYRAVQLKPHSWANHVRYSESLLALPDGRSRAWEAAVYAVRLAPQEPAVHRMIAAVARHGKPSGHDLDIAERALTEAARLSPTDPRVHFEMAHLRFLGAKDGEALDSVASALAADPTGIGAQSLAMARRQLLRVVFLHACVSVIGCFASGAILGPRPATGNRMALAALALVMGGGMILRWRRLLVGPGQRRLVGGILRESWRVRAAQVLIGITLVAWLGGALWSGTTGTAILGASLITASLACGLVWGPFVSTFPERR